MWLGFCFLLLLRFGLSLQLLCKRFVLAPPEEARRLARKLEVHYTPKHGSWLDIAEIGINIMTRECLNRRIGGIEELRKELKAWNEAYDRDPTEINWQFSNEISRVKLKSLYPDIEKNRSERERRQREKMDAQ